MTDNVKNLRALIASFRHEMILERDMFQKVNDTNAELLAEIMLAKFASTIDTIDEFIASENK